MADRNQQPSSRVTEYSSSSSASSDSDDSFVDMKDIRGRVPSGDFVDVKDIRSRVL